MATALLRPSLYEEDYLAWIEQQLALLRAGRTDDLDLGNLIEELGDMGGPSGGSSRTGLRRSSPTC